MYTIKLENIPIGTTNFEYADPPMGVVSGELLQSNPGSFYEFITKYIEAANIQTNLRDEENKCISTMSIPQLKVYRDDGIEIEGCGAYIEGMDGDGFRITVFGIPYPLYADEFPSHVQHYQEMK